ncbi:MAG TPA: hypothetical protein VHD57_06995 [Vicinamibacterales bacterium]|nr:hypothetical protein [Vicinamibacterales bacterium]
MMTHATTIVWLEHLDALTGGLFLLAAFGLVATRQIEGCLRLFIASSVLLATSALFLSVIDGEWHLVVVSGVDLVTKAVIIPRLLRRLLRGEVSARREVQQVLNIPSALLLALGLAIAGFLFAARLLPPDGEAPIGIHLPIGMASLLVGLLTASVRREALPLFLGLLAMENAAFFAGIGVAPELPLVAEVSIAFDVLMLVFVVGVLTRAVQEHVGTTEVGALTVLREEPPQ